ncbi:MAG: ARMT1-like domain-containing protein [Candidatus Hydrogenedentes bacterium]|nr:ARMT1-like domain-containing protein [Candidatus Hydrogenedentota bacterium]
MFDKILIEELLKHTCVTAVVKAAPILNDVLYEDAEQVGLTALCDVIDNGGAFIGSPLGLVPASFVERLRRADMLIGKGQGNYETLDEFPGDVFLILRAKCEAIATHMGVKYGQVALISTRARQGDR